MGTCRRSSTPTSRRAPGSTRTRRYTFAAPLGYLVSGVGAALFLVYGLWDQWWHGLYGFDAVLESPPHMGFLLPITLTMTGAVMVSSAAKGRGWSVPVTIAGLAVLLGFSTATTNGLSALGGGVVDLPTAGMAFMSVLTVVMGAQALDRWGRRAHRRRGAGGVPGVLLVVRPVGHPATVTRLCRRSCS
ncbi:hypothetical protein ACGFJC_49015 [Nonomuraea fuscirosea]|uniref:hypothetical protein n=1 Tax=Nonomuraea fuscirosea TaxID=1291556 RepID=UPI00371A3BC1